MTMRHTLLTLASASLLAACAVGATDADTGDDGNDDGGTSDGGAATTSSSDTGVGSTGSGGSPAATTGSGASTSSTGGMEGTGGQGGTTTATSSSVTSSSVASSSSSGNPNTCLHDVCTEGPALTMGCGDPCVDTVCANDSFCCDTQGGSWDNLCVDGAVQLCNASCNGGGTASPGDLVITEIMNNPAAVSDTNGEWFEVYNDAPYAIDLMGLTIQEVANSPTATHTISQSVVVQPGGYVVLGRNATFATNGGVNVDYQYTGVVLNNTTDYLALLDGSTILDEVNYSETSGLDPSGASRNLDPIYVSASMNDTDLHFCAATSAMSGGDAGTPGAPNDTCP